jgi:hypothetical protein
MSLASDWNAITRARRLSFEITPLVDGPFGTPPLSERETSFVFCTRAEVTVVADDEPAPATAAIELSATGSATDAIRRRVFLDIVPLI